MECRRDHITGHGTTTPKLSPGAWARAARRYLGLRERPRGRLEPISNRLRRKGREVAIVIGNLVTRHQEPIYPIDPFRPEIRVRDVLDALDDIHPGPEKLGTRNCAPAL